MNRLTPYLVLWAFVISLWALSSIVYRTITDNYIPLYTLVLSIVIGLILSWRVKR